MIDDEDIVDRSFNDTHPFNLKPFCRPNSSSIPIKYLKVIPSSILIDPMAIIIARELNFNPDLDNPAIRGLRKIKTNCDNHYKDHHRLYYEISCESATYLVGHSTDFSGHGKICKNHMDCLFAYLADRFMLSIEKVTIPYKIAKSIIRKMG